MFYLVIKIITIIICLTLRVQPMSLNGVSQTQYVPCGLGFLSFEKVEFDNPADTFWKSEINLGFYPYFLQANVEIVFEVPVTLFWTSHETITSSDNWTIKIVDIAPKQFKFMLKLDKSHTIPKIRQFTVNEQMLCKVDETEKNINCGRRSKELAELTTTGLNAKRGDWPWHVAIFIKVINSTESEYECGGSIISNTAVVTAAHCVQKKGFTIDVDRVIIIAGAVDFKEVNDKDSQRFTPLQIILNPSYNELAATSDLAILKVTPMTFTEYVQPICLWGPAFDKSQLFGKEGIFAGFGMTENNTFPNYLRATNLPVQSDADCVASSPILYKSLLNEFTFCAGFGKTGVNPRNGDSGSGLIFRIVQSDQKDSWFLRGVLSKCRDMTGHSLCDPKYYGVFTDVGPHYSWIMHHA